MHGGKATFVQFVPVRETFGGDTVSEGAVHVFDLVGRTVSIISSLPSTKIPGDSSPRSLMSRRSAS
jgi:hypothetical protein